MAGKKAKRKVAEDEHQKANWLRQGVLLEAARTDPRITVVPYPGSFVPAISAPMEVLEEVLGRHSDFINKALREYAETPRS